MLKELANVSSTMSSVCGEVNSISQKALSDTVCIL